MGEHVQVQGPWTYAAGEENEGANEVHDLLAVSGGFGGDACWRRVRMDGW